MNILLIHNFYQQPGGEDVAFARESDLLEANGHEVHKYTLHNDAIEKMNRAELLGATIWNSRVAAEIRTLVERWKIQVCHFHNTFPLVSPAAYYGAKSAGAAVVQTLHNYRLICPGTLLYRDGRVCEECVGTTFSTSSIQHACYRDSRSATSAVAGMTGAHVLLGTWQKAIDAYIVPNAFSRERFVQGGLPPEKLLVKSHFLESPVIGNGRGGYLMFIGRLVPEKGIKTLVGAWRRLAVNVPLKIAGDGPFRDLVSEAAGSIDGVEWLGQVSREQLNGLLREARMLVVPSEWYEMGPLTILEAFATGTPVIAAALGAAELLVEHGRTGLVFTPGDSLGLARQVEWAWTHPEAVNGMRLAARKRYESDFMPAANYTRLMEIYSFACHKSGSRAHAA